jgi:hypothetical protein
MKLSEAMRKGSELSYPLLGMFLIPEPGGKPCACALAAAFLAVAGEAKRKKVLKLALYYKTRDEAFDLADTHLSLVFGAVLEEGRVPVEKKHGGTEMTPLREAVFYLNDEWGWPRGRIADHLESFGF